MNTTQAARRFDTCKGCNSAVLVRFLNPVRGLCKVCEARELANEIVEQDDHGDARSVLAMDASDNDGLDSLGLGEEHDDLPAEQRIESIDPDVTRQISFDRLRASHGLTSRHFRSTYKPASVGQFGALKKLGWDATLIRELKLSIADASRLMQRGSVWSRKA